MNSRIFRKFENKTEKNFYFKAENDYKNECGEQAFRIHSNF